MRSLSANCVQHHQVRAESIVLASNSAARHCNQHGDGLLRWGLASSCTQLPQRPRYLGLVSEQSSCRSAAVGRQHGQHQHFWAPLMVLTSPLPARLVRRPEPIDISSCLLLTCAARSNLVRRPNSGAGRAAPRKTARSGRANPTRKRTFGGAWPPSSPVRRAARARPCLLAPAERVLLERAQDRVRDIRRL